MNYMALATSVIAGTLAMTMLVGTAVLTAAGVEVPPEMTDHLGTAVTAAIVSGPMAAQSLQGKRE